MQMQINAEASHDCQRTAIKAFLNICEKWGLNTHQMRILLGQPTKSTFYNWKHDKIKNVQYDTILRISYILGIFKGLEYLFLRPEDADAWIKKPNEHFGGQSALDRMLGGDVTDLAFVRSYLDAYRGGK